jgi:hypothetical protein
VLACCLLGVSLTPAFACALQQHVPDDDRLTAALAHPRLHERLLPSFAAASTADKSAVQSLCAAHARLAALLSGEAPHASLCGLRASHLAAALSLHACLRSAAACSQRQLSPAAPPQHLLTALTPLACSELSASDARVAAEALLTAELRQHAPLLHFDLFRTAQPDATLLPAFARFLALASWSLAAPAQLFAALEAARGGAAARELAVAVEASTPCFALVGIGRALRSACLCEATKGDTRLWTALGRLLAKCRERSAPYDGDEAGVVRVDCGALRRELAGGRGSGQGAAERFAELCECAAVVRASTRAYRVEVAVA